MISRYINPVHVPDSMILAYVSSSLDTCSENSHDEAPVAEAAPKTQEAEEPSSSLPAFDAVFSAVSSSERFLTCHHRNDGAMRAITTCGEVPPPPPPRKMSVNRWMVHPHFLIRKPLDLSPRTLLTQGLDQELSLLRALRMRRPGAPARNRISMLQAWPQSLVIHLHASFFSRLQLQ